MSKIKFKFYKEAIDYLKKNYKVIHLKTYIEERLFILTDKMWDQDNFAIIQVDAVAKSNWETQKVVFSPCVIDVFTIPVNEYKTLTPDYKLFNDILSLKDNDFVKKLRKITNMFNINIIRSPEDDPNDMFNPYFKFLENKISNNYIDIKEKNDRYKKNLTQLKFKLLNFMKNIFPNNDYTTLENDPLVAVSQAGLVFQKHFKYNGKEGYIFVYLEQGSDLPMYYLYGILTYRHTNQDKFVKKVKEVFGVK